MELDKLRILNILEELSRRDTTSQRELSKKLNISLGLVNSFIKRLVKKGYCKVTTLPRNRLKYILTPKGVAEKTKLTHDYLQLSFKFYQSARTKIKNILQNVKTQGVQKVAIYGTGELAEILFILLQQASLELTAVVDSNECRGKFMGRNIIGVKEIASLDCDMILITEIEQGQSVRQIADLLGLSPNKITLIQ